MMMLSWATSSKLTFAIHDEHNQCPQAPGRMVVSEFMLSKYTKALHSQNSNKLYQGTSKLTPNLHDKTKYILHYRILNLKFHMKHGLILQRIHQTLRFKQSRSWKQYIDFNTIREKKLETNSRRCSSSFLLTPFSLKITSKLCVFPLPFIANAIRV